VLVAAALFATAGDFGDRVVLIVPFLCFYVMAHQLANWLQKHIAERRNSG